MNTAVGSDSLISVPDLARKALTATVSLEVHDDKGRTRGRGSGFFVGFDLIATNFHVIQGATQGGVRLVNTETTYPIEGIAATDEANDLALLKVKVDDIFPLALGDSDNVPIGATVYAVGNPKGLEGTFSDGIISARRDIDGKQRLQMTTPISPGSSGGPVLIRDGKVIGVSASVYYPKDAQNLNFAIPSNALKWLIVRAESAEPSWDCGEIISAATYVQRGNVKIARRDFKGAIKEFTQVIRLKPANPLYYWHRGFAKGKLGKHYAAIGDYNRALRLNSDYAIAYHNRGYEWAQLGEYDVAITDYDEAIRLDPNYAVAYVHRGSAKRELDQNAAAISDFDEAIRLKPDEARYYVHRWLANSDLGQYAAAINDYDEAIRLKHNYSVAYHNRAHAKSEMGEKEAAISDYDESIRLKPNDAVTYHNRAVAKHDLGRYDAAVFDYDAALRLRPNDALTYYCRGLANRALERVSNAKQDLTMALTLALRAGDSDLQTDIETELNK